MFSAATTQASTAMSCASAALGTTSAARRITSQASTRFMAIWATAWGQPARSATETEIHSPTTQAIGVISGTSRSATQAR